ncbi:calcium-translocating P-type ATPase [Lactarius hengduanensis]|nr:calcium-translocating P-type ATPase [Lactarius hengduanensis]
MLLLRHSSSLPDLNASAFRLRPSSYPSYNIIPSKQSRFTTSPSEEILSNYVHTPQAPSQPPLSMYSSSQDQRDNSLVDPWLPIPASAGVSQPADSASHTISRSTYSSPHPSSTSLDDPTRHARFFHTASGSVPEITLVGKQDDSHTLGASSSTAPDSASSPLSTLGHTSTPSHSDSFLPLPTPILRDSRIYVDVLASHTPRTSDPSSSHSSPSPTLSTHSLASISWATSTVLRNNPEEHVLMSSLGLLSPPPQGHRRKGGTSTVSSIGASIFTDCDIEDSSSPRLSPVRFDRPDVPSAHPSTVGAGSDTSRPSSAANFKRIVQRLCHPSRETDMGSDTTLEANLNVEPFVFKPAQLADLVSPKSLENLERLGGVECLLRGLRTNRLRGLSTKYTNPLSRDPWTITAVTPDGVEIKPNMIVPEGLEGIASLAGYSNVGRPASSNSAGAHEATIEDRQRIYGHNIPPQRPTKGLLLLMWLAIQDKLLVLLLIAAVVLLSLDLFQDFHTTHPQGEPSVNLVEGVAIIVAILVVVAVGSLNDWQKERQFQALNKKKEGRLVKVIRDGGERKIGVYHVVVGDVVLLEPGRVISCDGVFLSGHNVRCDESSATGEPNAIKKLSYEECIALRDKRAMESDPDDPSGDYGVVSASRTKTSPSGLELLGHTDCFIVSGSRVLEGVGSYIVTSVGTKSSNGRIVIALRRDSENTPLQLKLNDLSEAIAKIGSIAGGLLFAALLVRYFVQLATNSPQRSSSEKGIAFVNMLIIAVTLVVVAVPEVSVALALAFTTNRMSKDNLLVRALGSCETLAKVSVICTDKTGTLTQNEMTVIAISVGVHAKFVRRLEEDRERMGSEVRNEPNTKDFDVDMANLNTVLSHPLKDLFNAAINSTAFEDVDPDSGAPVFVGSKTEIALLEFAMELGWPSYGDTHDSAGIVQMIPFSSGRKSMGCLVRLPNGGHRLYIKGASEVLAQKCTRHVVAYRDPANEAPGENEVETVPIGEMEEDKISHTIASYASQALRTVSLCYRDFPYCPPHGARLLDKHEVDYDDLMTDLTLICITAIGDPLRAGVREAVAICDKAGVRVKMCTGDNVLTARSIAQQCGIYTPGSIVMEGPHFRTLSSNDRKAIVPRLQVLARSSPDDKRILVETLKELGEVVGVTGEGTNDESALKTAHVGFSMGVAGTEVAKEASDIILMDDDFSSIVHAIMWGRCVNDSVCKFLQFLISAHFTTVVIMTIWALASSSERPILGAVQLLWIHIIMGTFATLALSTDPASPVLLCRNPNKTTDPLFSVNMTKQILGQASHQIIITLVLHFLGSRVLGFRHTDDPTVQKHHDEIVQTLVFNAFVFAQVSNLFNCRRLDRKLNVFEGVSKNRYFMAIITIEVAVQVFICFVGGAAFSVTRIGAREWGISVGLGCVSLPFGALIRLTPNEPCERVFNRLKLLPEPELLPTTRPDAEPGFSFAVDQVRDSLGTFAKLRGSRMRGSSFVRESRDPDGQRSVPGLLAIVPSPDVSHVATPEWQPGTSESLSDPIGFGRSGSSAALCENGLEVHAGPPRDDPVYGLLGMTRRPATPR